MSSFVNFFEKIGDNTATVLQKTGDTVFGIANIPISLGNAAANIGNGIAGFISSPLSGITLPILAIAAIYIIKGK